jgi:hypothetical protein
MEIGPIPAIRAVPPNSSRGNGFDLPAVFEVKDSARAGDETYNGKGNEPAGGQDDESEDETAELLDDGEVESAAPVPRDRRGVQINFFA